MSDPVAQIQQAATAPISFAKKNPIGFAVVMILAIAVLLHFSGAINRWIAGRAQAAPSGTWAKVGRWTGAVVGILALLSFARDAVAGVDAHSVLGIGAGLVSMASAFAFPQPDYVALKDENGNYLSTLTPGTVIAERKFMLSAPREVVNGFPLKVTDVDFTARVTLDNSHAASGNLLYWDQLFCIVAGLEIVSPRFGTICDKNAYSGPVAKHFGEYIGNGFAYSGDEALATIAGDGTTYYVNLNISYPFMHRCLAKPEESAMFVGWLQATQLKINLAPATQIAEVSEGSTIAGADVQIRCGYRQFLDVGHGNPQARFTVPPLAYRRTMLTPANGQFDIVFPQVSQSGPQNTTVKNGERLLAAVLLSDNVGLPGAGTLEAITEIGCDGLGQLNTYNPDQFVRAKMLIAERRINGLSALGAPPASPNRVGWPYTLAAESGGEGTVEYGKVLTSTLLGIAFALPGVQQKISKLPRIKGDLQVHALQPTPPSGSGRQQAMYIETLRDIAGDYAQSLLAAAGINRPITRAVNHNADAAVSAGQAKPANYTGMPQGPK